MTKTEIHTKFKSGLTATRVFKLRGGCSHYIGSSTITEKQFKHLIDTFAGYYDFVSSYDGLTVHTYTFKEVIKIS